MLLAEQRQQNEARQQRSHDAAQHVDRVGASGAIRIARRPAVHQHRRQKSDDRGERRNAQ